MAIVSLRQLLDHAAENGYGVPAFNVNNMEQVQAIMSAASEVGAPVIMQASAGARRYTGELFLKNLIQAAVETYPDVPVCMHQDHGQNPAVCQGAIRMGFSSVMMDGSLQADGKTIASYDYNVNVTRQVVDMAHCIGVSVEGELGCLGSLETLLKRLSLTHWQLPSVPAMVPTNSVANRPVIFCLLNASKKSTVVYRTPIWSCTVLLQSRKNI